MPNDDLLMNDAIPLAFRLSQNYPNPFRGKTRITYCVAYKTRVQLTVLSPGGEVIDTLVDEEKNPGTHEIDFAACVSSSGGVRNLAGGKYCYRMEAGDFVCTKNLVVLK